MVATSADVARHAGVSRATVSQILNGRHAKFADATRAKVLQAAADLGYHPSAAGRTLARGSSDFVIALIPNTTFHTNLQDIFEDMTDQLAAHGFTLMLRLATRSSASLDRIVATVLPAAVFSLTPFTAAERQVLEDHQVPAIDPTSVEGTDNNEEIGRIQARYLIERGHTRLGFAHLHDTRQDPFGEPRAAGVRAVCREAGLGEPVIVHLGIDLGEAREALAQLGPRGVAVACYNDDVATALLTAALLAGWRVPEDIALIGMDATPLSRLTLPPLATVTYSVNSAVNSAAEVVLGALGIGSPGAASTQAAIEIIEGGTV